MHQIADFWEFVPRSARGVTLTSSSNSTVCRYLLHTIAHVHAHHARTHTHTHMQSTDLCVCVCVCVCVRVCVCVCVCVGLGVRTDCAGVSGLGFWDIYICIYIGIYIYIYIYRTRCQGRRWWIRRGTSRTWTPLSATRTPTSAILSRLARCKNNDNNTIMIMVLIISITRMWRQKDRSWSVSLFNNNNKKYIM
jgi:hypothetical protein